MHTVELLQEALDAARRVGYDVRQDWLGGDGGGHCIVRGRRLLLLDVAQSPAEQLDVVADALRGRKKRRGHQNFAQACRACRLARRANAAAWVACYRYNPFAAMYAATLAGTRSAIGSPAATRRRISVLLTAIAGISTSCG